MATFGVAPAPDTAVRVADVAMTRVREGINAYLFWLTIIVIVMLGLPFVFGYITGRAVSRSRRVGTAQALE